MKCCKKLENNNINILDISQTIVQGYFNMMMLVDMNNTEKTSEIISKELDELGMEIGVIIKSQHEDIFYKMHRV